jgi:hypothetical protein
MIAQTKSAKTALSRSLDVARRDLLDLGLRNPLLNYKPLRAKGLDNVKENPVDLFRILVHEEKRMSFLPFEFRSRHRGEAGELTELENDSARVRHPDFRIQTEYPSQQLQTRLPASRKRMVRPRAYADQPG